MKILCWMFLIKSIISLIVHTLNLIIRDKTSSKKVFSIDGIIENILLIYVLYRVIFVLL